MGCLSSEKRPKPRAGPGLPEGARASSTGLLPPSLPWALAHRTNTLWPDSGGKGGWSQVVKGSQKLLRSSEGGYP